MLLIREDLTCRFWAIAYMDVVMQVGYIYMRENFGLSIPTLEKPCIYKRKPPFEATLGKIYK